MPKIRMFDRQQYIIEYMICMSFQKIKYVLRISTAKQNVHRSDQLILLQSYDFNLASKVLLRNVAIQYLFCLYNRKSYFGRIERSEMSTFCILIAQLNVTRFQYNMVLGFTTTCAISAVSAKISEFESRSWRGVLDTP